MKPSLSLASSRSSRAAPPSRARAWLFRVGAVLFLAASVAGCAHSEGATSGKGGGFQARNYFRAAPQLPSTLRRVAVLPISVPGEDWQAGEGRKELEPLLRSELSKVGRFELVTVPVDWMRQATGREAWGPAEELPYDFLKRVRTSFVCDAVLFSHLQPYRGYRPLVVGWNCKLVDLDALMICWSVDEVFDAGQPAVSKAAQQYFHGRSWPWTDEDPTIGLSPRRFGQFTLAKVFETLPER